MNKRANGYVLITDPDTGKSESDTFTCCHCNRIVMIHFGSGVKRGFCFTCNAPHCGGNNCWHCIPFEAKLEAMEGTRRLWKQLEI